MSVLYIKEQGAMIQKRGERIVVSKSKEELLEAPLANIESIALIGQVQISTQALHMLLEAGIDISYFSLSGKFLGHTVTDSSKNVFLRFEQHELYNDIERRMNMARVIVDNKVRNQMEVIRQYRWDDSYDWHPDMKQMERIIAALPSKKLRIRYLGLRGCVVIFILGYTDTCSNQKSGLQEETADRQEILLMLF